MAKAGTHTMVMTQVLGDFLPNMAVEEVEVAVWLTLAVMVETLFMLREVEEAVVQVVLLLLVAIGVYGVTEDKQVRLVLVTE